MHKINPPEFPFRKGEDIRPFPFLKGDSVVDHPLLKRQERWIRGNKGSGIEPAPLNICNT